MVATTLREYGHIDILVNSVGAILRKPIEEITDEEWDSLMEVNLRGIFVWKLVPFRTIFCLRTSPKGCQ